MLIKWKHWKKKKFEQHYLKSGKTSKVQFGENAFWAFANILVNNEKLDLNAALNKK